MTGKAKATDGILVSVNSTKGENVMILDREISIRQTASVYGGTVETLERFDTNTLLFIHFKNADQKAAWLQYAMEHNLIE